MLVYAIEVSSNPMGADNISPQLEALLAKLKEDETLRASMLEAKTPEAALSTSKASGFDVTQADYDAYMASNSELSDAELTDVAGGYPSLTFPSTCCSPYISCTY